MVDAGPLVERAREQLLAMGVFAEVAADTDWVGFDAVSLMVERRGSREDAVATFTVDGDRRALTFVAPCRPRRFRTLTLLSDGKRRSVGARVADAFTSVGDTRFANGDLERSREALLLFARYPCRIDVHDGELAVSVGDIAGRSDIALLAAALLKLWRGWHPVGEEGGDRRRRSKTRRKPKKPRKHKARVAEADDHVDAMRDWAIAAAAAYAGAAERVGDAVGVRASLAGHLGNAVVDEAPTARLLIGFSTARSRITRTDLRAMLTLPRHTGDGTLTHAQGLMGRLMGVLDDKIGDKEIDRAFRIELLGLDGRLVIGARHQLLALTDERPRLAFKGTHLVITLGEAPCEAARIHTRIERTLSLWRAVASVQLEA